MSVKPQLEQIVGSPHVIDDPAILDGYAADQSLVKGKRPDIVVRPHTVEEIQQIVRLANKTKIPLTPYSSGLNLHGAALPSRGGMVLDLTRMKQIEINEDDWLVIIEPGVTYAELQDALNAKGLRLMVPFGVPPQRSVLTSYLERDTMLAAAHIEYGNFLIHDTELILPDGEFFRTGCWNLSGRPGGFYGPGFNTLYRLWTGAQGTLGIFTKMIISAQHLSNKRKFLFIPFQSSEKIPEFIKIIQRKEIGWECFGLNRFNLAAILNDEWAVPGKFPASKKQSSAFARLQESLPAWTVIIGLSGSPYYPEERIDYEEEALKNLCREMNIVIDSNIKGFQNIEDIFLRESLRPWSVLKKFNYKGAVQDLSFKVPLKKLHEIEKTVCEAAQGGGYPFQDIGGYFVVVERGRGIHCEFDLHDDPGSAADKERLRSVWLSASKTLMDRSALFDRPYGAWAEMAYSRMPQYALKLKQIKNEMDPKGILNPGKLCF
jgi:FAD/FMN-containing dehydrogenase